jgi:hypothetical protein
MLRAIDALMVIRSLHLFPPMRERDFGCSLGTKQQMSPAAIAALRSLRKFY